MRTLFSRYWAHTVYSMGPRKKSKPNPKAIKEESQPIQAGQGSENELQPAPGKSGDPKASSVDETEVQHPTRGPEALDAVCDLVNV